MQELRALSGVWVSGQNQIGGFGACFQNGSRYVPRRKTARGFLFSKRRKGLREPCGSRVAYDTIPSGWAGSEHTPSYRSPLPLPPNKESADVALPFTEEQLKAIRGVLTARGVSLEADPWEFLKK